MASSVPAAVDWLVEQLRAAIAKPTVVSDGWPVTRSNDAIIVGITRDGDETGVVVDYAQLSGLDEESVVLPSLIMAHRTGEGAASAARSAAVGLLDVLRATIAADRRMGGAIRPGLPARVSSWRMLPTSTVRQAGEGRTCQISVMVSWQHRG